ncbi:MAG: hypothetical protein K0S33_3328 [Bacteroidetes bacterium]|nr:hypothetical protein [Bacteroidota bacterium]
MKRTYFLRALVIGFICIQSIAASAQQKCASDEIHAWHMANDDVYRQKTLQYEQAVLAANAVSNETNRTVLPVYKIPVVVHVMHKGEAVGTGTNISDDDIKNGIKYLNQRYRKIAGTPGDGTGVDVEIEFALAVRDVNGNCTNGITRNDMSGDATYMQYGVKRSGANGITDAALKAIISWNQSQYYNMWLISEIDDNNGGNGTQGYAFFASSHGTATDGAVMLGNSFIRQDRITLTHELGHALNLYHTFEGDVNGTTCPTGNQCGSGLGDCCGDIPPHRRTTVLTCTDVANTCDGGSTADLYIHNYLDYSSDGCQNMFTANQKTRMITALTTTRASFLESNGNMSLVPPTLAEISFISSSGFACTGSTIDFTDHSSCSPNTYLNTPWTSSSYNWTFTNNSGTTYTSTDQNPSITFANAGTYDITLSITNPAGTSSYTNQGMIIISTAPTAGTCVGTNTGPTSNLGYGIYTVALNTLYHLSGSTYADIQSGATNGTGYGDFSCAAGTVLEANTSYTLTLKGTSNAGLTEDFRTYIDYNNNGVFTDPGEEIAFFNDIVGSAGTMSMGFTTPAAPTLNTSLRMRIVSGRNTETVTSCTNTTRGQFQDYSVWITDKVARVSITASPSGTINAGTLVTFTATPVNGGITPSYKWYKNNVLIPGENNVTYASTSLADNDMIHCVMTSNLTNVIASPCTSNVSTMDVNCTAPTVSNHPDNATLCEGDTITFLIDALNAMSYFWELSTNGGGSWSPISNSSLYMGADTAVLTMNGVLAGMNTYLYRCIAIGACAPNAASNPATLNVTALPSAPTTNTTFYCQFSTTVPLTAGGSNLLWYTSLVGGTGSSVAPTPSSAIPGPTSYYVSQSMNGCEGPRATSVVTVLNLPVTPSISANGLVLTSNAASGNQWSLNGGPINGATSQTYTVTQNGSYTVVVIDGNGCVSAVSAPITINNVGLNSTAASVPFSIFPNPNKGEFLITCTAGANTTLEVTNLLGETIHKETIHENNTTYSKQLDISKYGAGLYFVTLKSGRNSACRKVVVQ